MREVQRAECMSCTEFCVWEITLYSLQTERLSIWSALTFVFYLIYIIEGSLFKAPRHFFAFCRLCAYEQQADNNNRCPAHMPAHYSPTGIGSRRSFAFALIGCIIWDTSSGVKPSEEEKEEAWEACALGGGWVSITPIKLNCPWFEYIYTFVLKTIILFIQEVQRDLSSQGDFFLYIYTCLVLINLFRLLLAEEK